MRPRFTVSVTHWDSLCVTYCQDCKQSDMRPINYTLSFNSNYSYTNLTRHENM